MEFSSVAIWGLFISAIIKIIYQAGHSLFPTGITFNEATKSLIYTVTGAALAFAIVYLLRIRRVSEMLAKISNKSINDDIWGDITSHNESTILKIYLKESDILYIGTIATREEKGLDSWVVITNYIRANKNNELQYCPKTQNENSMVAVNMRDIERVELVYQDNSKIWEWYNTVEDD
jgi:hypothetical protein